MSEFVKVDTGYGDLFVNADFICSVLVDNCNRLRINDTYVQFDSEQKALDAVKVITGSN